MARKFLMVVEVTTTDRVPEYPQMADDLMSMMAHSIAKAEGAPVWLVSVDSSWVDTKRRYEVTGH